jgi:hypothetical protein
MIVVVVEPTTTVTYAGRRETGAIRRRSVTGTLKLSRENFQTL